MHEEVAWKVFDENEQSIRESHVEGPHLNASELDIKVLHIPNSGEADVPQL
jgi:hypothetical protein